MAEAWPRMQAVDFDPFADASPASTAPLTAAQRELYAAIQMSEEAHCAFNLVYVLHLRGELAPDSMQAALQQVVDRHAALRLRLLPDGSGQELMAHRHAELPLLDLADWDEAAREQAMQACVAEETGTPFDLQQAVWRARLLRLREDHHALVFTVHHLASDGWSSSVILGDLARAYAADRFGLPATQPPALPYEDYLQWQASEAVAEEEQASRAYWLARHSPPAAPLALPTDHPRPAYKTYACGHVSVPMTAQESRAVRALGARHGCTLFVTMLAAYQGLLSRLSGSADIVVGIPMANQTLLDNGHVVAHGAQTVPLRAAVDVDQPFAQGLAAVRKLFLDAQAHQHLSFGNLVHDLSLPRDPSRTPLVDVLFNIDRLGAPFDFGSLTLERIETPKVFSNAELSTNVIDDGRQLLIECHFNSALIDSGTALRWLHTYVQALRRLSADERLSLAEALAPAAAEQELLARFNDTRAPYPEELRLEALFERQVRRAPDSVALWCDGRTWSYAALDAMANGVAQSLLAAGVLAGERIGLFCGRHEHMVAGVLGVLKAGAAYVPLDPAFPAERLAMMSADAQLRIVACDAGTASGWSFGQARLLRLDQCAPQASSAAPRGGPRDAAYVIYTSGSTGRPKGVVVSHRSVVNFVTSVAQRPGLRSTDRLAAVATLSFDMSVMDLFLPLSLGASLAVLPRHQVQDGAALGQALRDCGASVMQAAPSIWRLLLQAGWPGQPGLRAFLGGEALPADLAHALQRRGVEVWNFYGPTETTVYSSCWHVPAEVGAMRVGQPIANTDIHVLDERLRVLPLGAVGEICIGGDGVALGYLDRAELTRERFVPEPGREGRRLYRTGDLGRWHADGTLECLGRIDNQIKLRGHRIEPGEIEAALVAVPGVAQALVLLREDVPGEPQLVAYVVLTPMGVGRHDLRSWREALRRTLPENLLPSQVVELAALPMLPNGKIDRRALPAPSREARPAAQVSRSVELTAPEAAVAAVWQQLLHLQHIEPTDNFFDLGGHSLLAARASQQIEQALGHRVGVPRLVMETLAQIALPSAQAPALLPGAPAAQGSWLKRLAGSLRRG